MVKLKFVIRIDDSEMEVEIPVIGVLMQERLKEIKREFQEELKVKLLEKLVSDGRIADATCKLRVEHKENTISTADVNISRNAVKENNSSIGKLVDFYARCLVREISFRVVMSEEFRKVIT